MGQEKLSSGSLKGLKKIAISLVILITTLIAGVIILIIVLLTWGISTLTDKTSQIENIKDQTVSQVDDFKNQASVQIDQLQNTDVGSKIYQYQQDLQGANIIGPDGLVNANKVKDFFEQLPNQISDQLILDTLKLSPEQISEQLNINLDQAQQYLEIVRNL